MLAGVVTLNIIAWLVYFSSSRVSLDLRPSKRNKYSQGSCLVFISLFPYKGIKSITCREGNQGIKRQCNSHKATQPVRSPDKNSSTAFPQDINVHTHAENNSLKRSVSPSPKCGTSKARENRNHSAVPDKAKRCRVRSHEGERRGSSWEVLATETCFCKTNETQGKPQTCSVVWEQVVLDLTGLCSPAMEETHAAAFVEVLLFDHDFGTVITVSSSSFPGNRRSRMRVEFLFSEHLLPSGGKRCNGTQGLPGHLSQRNSPGDNLQPGPSHWGAQAVSRAGSSWKEGGRELSHPPMDRERPGSITNRNQLLQETVKSQ